MTFPPFSFRAEISLRDAQLFRYHAVLAERQWGKRSELPLPTRIGLMVEVVNVT